jgi:hypothetical protein
VTNGLYLVLAARLYEAKRADLILTAAKIEYGIL